MKLNFMTDQGSILASTSWARRVGAALGTFPVLVAAATRSFTAAGPGGGGAGRGERGGFLVFVLVRAANGAATLAAIPADGAGGIWDGYGGA
jgi:hypothetical protein